jgi:glutathione S-transferase
MKLYLSPGACATSCHIAFEEAHLKFEPVISNWDDVNKFNPQGAVPVLVFDDGKVLTQNIAILTYAAEMAPNSGLLPKPGTFERVQAYQWLSWVASDLHPTIGELFDESLPEDARKKVAEATYKLFDQAEQYLAGKTYLVGNQFTAADAYLFVVYGWSKHLGLTVDKYRNLNSFAGRIAERPAVQTVLKREGLIK